MGAPRFYDRAPIVRVRVNASVKGAEASMHHGRTEAKITYTDFSDINFVEAIYMQMLEA